MRRISLGQSELSIAIPGLGCMGMSEFYGPRDDDRALDTLEGALELGIDFLDTADTYGFGHNEELLGRFLKGKRDKVVLATKFGIVRQPGNYERRIDNSPAYIASACDASLKRLGVETIDLYYMHRRNPDTPLEAMIGAMADLVKAGKVRTIGLSEVSPATLRAAHAIHPITAVQSEYSLWSREPESGLLETCRELGVTFVAYSPLGRGFLTGKVNSQELPDGDFRKAIPRFQDEAAERNRHLAEALATFASARNASAAQIALAWMLNKHSHVAPIFGTTRRVRLQENLAAASISLAPAEVAELDALFPPEAVTGGRYPQAGMVGIEPAV